MGMTGRTDECRVSNTRKGSRAVCRSLKEELLFDEGAAAAAAAAVHMTRQPLPIPFITPQS